MRNWFILRGRQEGKQEEARAQEIITLGVYERGGSLYLCPPDDNVSARVVKVVSIPVWLYEEYQETYRKWSAVQGLLDKFPRSLRPRRPSQKTRVEIPDLATSPDSAVSEAGNGTSRLAG